MLLTDFIQFFNHTVIIRQVVHFFQVGDFDERIIFGVHAIFNLKFRSIFRAANSRFSVSTPSNSTVSNVCNSDNQDWRAEHVPNRHGSQERAAGIHGNRFAGLGKITSDFVLLQQNFFASILILEPAE